MTNPQNQNLSERDICTKFITPALVKAGWDVQKQIREEVSFTAGRIIVRGKTVSRGKAKRADYILYYKSHFPLVVIEAKDADHSLDAGLPQAVDYGETLDVPFVYSSNGSGFIEHDRTKYSGNIQQELSLEEFPSPENLYARYRAWRKIAAPEEKIINEEYFEDIGGKQPRYFQQIAINRAIEAIVKGQQRLLLVMATGTGKTYTAFQIAWRLWKAGAKKRILFLVDRNILADQPRLNDFAPFGDKMTKITQRNADKAYEVYLALYQAVTGTEEERNIYKQFSPDFFDLVIVDECHRGSAKANSAWREILEYYSGATQIGLTATPKETKDISNIEYFGEPVYTYSLKQGIEDGFLAPYKVVRITLDKDLEWRPEAGTVDVEGEEVPDRIYNVRDYDRNIILDKRTEVVAKKITEFLKNTDRFDKTIVFCANINHAERMTRALINENADLASQNSKYVVRITGDQPEGKKELDNFINPESKYPVIAVTSKLMTTGVDAQTCKVIVLDQIINSISEFKQIIGRGTRVHEDYGKFFFTIIDFRNATELFADPAFDGPPIQIYEPKKDESPVPPEASPEHSENQATAAEEETVIYDIASDGAGVVREKPKVYRVRDVEVKIIQERVQYYDENGKLISESLKDYSKKSLLKEYASLDEFLNAWKSSERKEAIIEELRERGVFLDELKRETGKDLDEFDLICHVAFGKPPLTRYERAENVKKRNYFAAYEANAREVLSALLEKYADQGITAIENPEVLRVSPFIQFGTPYQIINDIFGGREKYVEAVQSMEQALYSA
ncbi:MAG: DEAD/DEAH box helicase family protein [bacterium]|nr:DEAD/DEAH box helicase family protein [bacterium]